MWRFLVGALGTAAAEENKKINTATAIGGAAVGVVAGVAQLLSNLRAPQTQNQQQQQREDRDRDRDRDRDKEPSEEELRARAPPPPSPDDIEKLRRHVDSTELPKVPIVDMDSALFAFRLEDVAEIRRILAEHGAIYEIIRAPK